MVAQIMTADLPKNIGPYRILDVLGEGGMATVYLAEQSKPVKRRVALKIIKAGMDSKQVVARFESERQALAILDHPNIAKIFDGGIAESGRPYFVMELVKGSPITDYCDDHRLNNKARIRLFIDICAAIQHAHLKGLIHRDLKPSNILVTVVDGKPQPKVIDFGIAKATTALLNEATLFTRVGQIVGTPAYMSPEQAGLTGLDIDTRTDIYSLGVVLYELLVGSLPLDLVSMTDQALQIALSQQDPPRPSTRFTDLGDTSTEIAKARATEPAALKSQLQGDLDWVVMHAIEKDRTRRYETVNTLAMECRRYLKRQPVLARPPSPGYLLKRFVQRNKLAVVAASIAMLAILAGSSAAILGYVQASEAEKVARQEAETAKQVSDFMVDLFEVSDPGEGRGNNITAREILDQGAEKINRSLDIEPVIKARLLRTIGRVYQELGLYEPSSIALSSSLGILRSTDSDDQLELAKTLSEYGLLLYELGDFESAKLHFLETLEIREAKLNSPHIDIVSSLRNIGFTYSLLDDNERALAFVQQARDMLYEIPDEDPQMRIALTNNLANIYSDQDRNDEAIPLYREVLEAHYELFGEYHLNTGFAHDNLAISLDALDQLEEAEQHYRKALEVLRVVYGDKHPEVAQTMNNVASFLVDIGKLEEAEKLIHKAIAIFRSTIGEDYYMIADSLINLSELNLQRDKKNAALEYIRQALGVYAKTLPQGHAKVSSAKAMLAEILLELGHYEEAEQELKKLQQAPEFTSQEANREYVLELLVELHTALDQPELAESYQKQRLTL